MRRLHTTSLAALVVGCAVSLVSATQQRPADQDGFRFRSGVELINVTATVTDRSGRFVSGLKQNDFLVYEDDAPVEVTHFSAERVPVSLGIVLDTSGSMAGEKIDAARDAISRLLYQLSDRDDEVFVYTFDGAVYLLQGWTNNKELAGDSLRRVRPSGGTAMYDGMAEAVPMAQRGRNRKKAVVLISDGNDTNSITDARDVKRAVQQTEVLVYAVGIDGNAENAFTRQAPVRRPPPPVPMPFPGGRGGIGGGGRGTPWPQPPQQFPPGNSGGGGRSGERLNVAALRELTDDSGGRTEIVRDPRDIDPATTSIADELSKQYYLGYASRGYHDGRWHTIRVELRDPASYRIRSRRGYIANP